VLLKVTHEIARVGQLLEALDEAAQAAGLATTLRGSPAVGTALVGVDAADGARRPSAEAVRELVDRLRGRSGAFGGSVVVLEAPAEVRQQLDVWGPVSALELMHSVKQRFDPERRLAPGRFVGGI
jgi:glycolate oxidase FAD binding subunit